MSNYFHSVYSLLKPQNSCIIASPTLDIISLLSFGISSGCMVVSDFGLVFISVILMLSIFLCAYLLFMNLLLELSIQIFPHFKIGCKNLLKEFFMYARCKFFLRHTYKTSFP